MSRSSSSEEDSDDLAISEVRETLASELRERYGLADNCFGNKVIDKVVRRSNNSLAKARTILPQYIEEAKKIYPKQFEQLIILKFMDEDDETDADAMAKKKQQRFKPVPEIISYMEYNTYRPTLDR